MLLLSITLPVWVFSVMCVFCIIAVACLMILFFFGVASVRGEEDTRAANDTYYGGMKTAYDPDREQANGHDKYGTWKKAK